MRLRPLSILLLLVLLLPAVRAAAAGAPATNRLVVASWNVENLFDADDDPANPGDDDFTPNGWTRWTPARYATKIDHLAEIIAAMQPDIVGLAEIENRRVLDDLVAALHAKQHYDLPVILHREGGDKRGIDVALLARFAPVATNWLSPVPEQRDILIARFEVGGRPLTVAMNHWKSWTGDPAENIRIRTVEAHAARSEIARRLAGEPRAALLAMGDFNDNVDSQVMTQEAGFRPWGAVAGTGGTGTLYNLSGMLAVTNRGTFYYGKDRVWNSFDSISVSAGMLPAAPAPAAWQAATNAYGPFILSQQRDPEGRPLPFHRVRSKAAGDVYLTGYSDHFPVRCELQASAP
jgi:endonuclease/exonuclease/phosphatase family metal-dependent hydrolase